MYPQIFQGGGEEHSTFSFQAASGFIANLKFTKSLEGVAKTFTRLIVEPLLTLNIVDNNINVKYSILNYIFIFARRENL